MSAFDDEFEAPAGYLDFASIGPPGRTVRHAVEQAMAAVGSAAVPIADVLDPMGDLAKTAIARLLATDHEHATYVSATSEGLAHAAFGLLGGGGNVVAPANEFPANLYPWLRAEAVGGPVVRLVHPDHGRVTADVLAPAIDDDTRAIAVSLVDYHTGFRIDLDEIAAVAQEALVIVDAVQAAGAVRTSLGPVDLVVAGGQKWMRAGFGAGVMAVSDRLLDRLAPTMTGWWGVEGAFDFHVPPPHEPRRDAERLHLTAPDPVGGVAAAASIAVIESAGIDAIETAVLDRAEAIEVGLRALGLDVIAPWRRRSERAGIVTFVPAGDPEVTQKRLAASGYVVTARHRHMRVSAHATTPPAAIEGFLEALAGA
jgi:selenocysteine lyase/cysteine desulfurase